MDSMCEVNKNKGGGMRRKAVGTENVGVHGKRGRRDRVKETQQGTVVRHRLWSEQVRDE